MKGLHEMTISEVNPITVWTKNGFWELNEERGKEKGMKPIKVFTEKDLKQWAIAIVKENRKKIKVMFKEKEVFEASGNISEERILAIDIGEINGVNIFLRDKLGLTEEDLK